MLYKTGDYYTQLQWIKHFEQYGLQGFSTLYHSTKANYPPLFMFIYALLAQLPQPSEIYTLLYMKIVPIAADFVMAFFVYKFVFTAVKNKAIALFAFGAFLLSPMPLLNSGTWGQVDILYSLFAVASAYYLFKEKNTAAFLLLGVSIALKTNGVFLLPIFIVVAAYRKIKPLYFFLIFVPHILATSLAALIFQAPFRKTLLISFAQIEGGLSRNAPNLAVFLSNYQLNSTGFVWLLSLAVFACMVLFYVFQLRQKELSMDKFVLWCLTTSLTVVCLLPHMHERFFMIPETFSLIYVFMRPKYFYITLMIHLASFSAYLDYLIDLPIFSLPHSALLMLAALCLLYRILYYEEYHKA